jgi:hypothetical protein
MGGTLAGEISIEVSILAFDDGCTIGHWFIVNQSQASICGVGIEWSSSGLLTRQNHEQQLLIAEASLQSSSKRMRPSRYISSDKNAFLSDAIQGSVIVYWPCLCKFMSILLQPFRQHYPTSLYPKFPGYPIHSDGLPLKGIGLHCAEKAAPVRLVWY